MRLCPILLSVLVSPLLATAVASQPVEWDAERAARLAKELEQAIADLDRSFRLEAPQAAGGGSTRMRFGNTLRKVRAESRALAGQLASGASADETRAGVDRMGGLIRDLREEGRRMNLVEPMLGHARRAEAIVAELAPYYAEPVPPEPTEPKGGS